jgi:hypothetical protein
MALDALCTDSCLGLSFSESESDSWFDREIDDFFRRSEGEEDPQLLGCETDELNRSEGEEDLQLLGFKTDELNHVSSSVLVDGMQRYENDGSNGQATALAEVSRPHTQSPPSVHVRACARAHAS